MLIRRLLSVLFWAFLVVTSALLFPVAFVVQQLLRGRRDALALALFVASFVLAMLSKGLLGRDAANLVLAFGNVAWATLLLLLATARCLQVAARDAAT